MALVSWQFSKDDEESKRFLNDPAIKALLENAKPLSTVSFSDYSAIFYVGGHGPVLDLAKDEVNIELANKVRPNRIRRTSATESSFSSTAPGRLSVLYAMALRERQSVTLLFP